MKKTLKSVLYTMLILGIFSSTVSGTDLGLTDGIKNIRACGEKRIVPTVFEKSAEHTTDNLLYFPMPKDQTETFNKLSGGIVVMDTYDFFDPSSYQGTDEFGSFTPIFKITQSSYLKLNCTKNPSDLWMLNIREKANENFDFSDGDIVLFKAKARLNSGGQIDVESGLISVGIGVSGQNVQASPDNGIGYSTTEIMPNEWTDVYYAGKLDIDLADKYYFTILWGNCIQQIDIKDIQIINYGNKIN